MSAPNSRDEAFLMLPELALGMLPAGEAERVMAYVNESQHLQNELTSLRGTVGALAHTATDATLSAERQEALKTKLMARIAAGPTPADLAAIVAAAPARSADELTRLREATTTPSVVREIPRPAEAGFLQRAAPMAFLLAAAALAISMMRMNSLATDLAASTDLAKKRAGELAARDSMIAGFSGPNVRVFDLASATTKTQMARVFIDTTTHHCMVLAHDLKTAPKGRTYQLWLVTKDAKMNAGTFNSDAQGRATIHATMPVDDSALAMLAITEEPAGGSKQPTGTILVAGAPTQ